jgi:hypothetical protein
MVTKLVGMKISGRSIRAFVQSYAIGKINGTNRMMRPNTATDFEFLKILPSMRISKAKCILKKKPKALKADK